MTTLAFRVSGQPASRRAPLAEHSANLRPSGAAAGILATVAALAAMVALVVLVRFGIYALGHTDQPAFRMLIDRLAS